MHPRRLRSHSYVGCARYFLTICTFRRVHHFVTPSVVQAAESEWLRTCDDYAFEDLARCFMPDHLHALVEGTRADSDLRKFVSMFKQRSSFRHRREGGSVLWQDGFYDRVLRDDESTPMVISYILNNPVRAGLAESATDYPHIGATRYSRQELAAFVQMENAWRPPRG